MHNDRHVDVKPEPVKLAGLSVTSAARTVKPISLAADAAPAAYKPLSDYKIAHLTGTTRLILHDEQRKDLKDFVEKGGTLIVDAAGGSTDFADSAREELVKIFGEDATKGLAMALPPEHPAFGDFAKKIPTKVYRKYAKRLLTGSLHDPRICGIAVAGGRIGVFYSREDLTAGLVGEPVDGVVGYEPAAATELMADLVMYATTNTPKDPTPAKPLATGKTAKATSAKEAAKE